MLTYWLRSDCASDCFWLLEGLSDEWPSIYKIVSVSVKKIKNSFHVILLMFPLTNFHPCKVIAFDMYTIGFLDKKGMMSSHILVNLFKTL